MAIATTVTECMTYALQNLKLPEGYSLEFTNSYSVYDLRHRVDWRVTDHRGNAKRGTSFYADVALQEARSSFTWGIHIYDDIHEAVDWLLALSLED